MIYKEPLVGQRRPTINDNTTKQQQTSKQRANVHKGNHSRRYLDNTIHWPENPVTSLASDGRRTVAIPVDVYIGYHTWTEEPKEWHHDVCH